MDLFSYTNLLYGTQQAHWQVEECGNEFECTTYGEANDAKGQHNKPDDRIEKQNRQRDRPADDEKNTEEQQLEHGSSSC
jgi:hypothetical protein